MSSSTESESLRDRVASHPLWYHTLELPGGLVTPGWFDLRPVVDRLPWPDVRGRRCLDVGTYDGFLAFELERRGAAEVVAVDIDDHAAWDWPPQLRLRGPEYLRELAGPQRGVGFRIARDALGSSVEHLAVSVYDLRPERVGAFDLVVCGSLLLHLRDPVGALMAVRSVCRGEVLLLDAIDPLLTRLSPRLPLATLDGRHRPWWWWPNLAALVRMAEAAGFALAAPPVRVRMPAGRGQPRLPLRVLRSREGRRSYVSARFGDPHAALLLRPIGQ